MRDVQRGAKRRAAAAAKTLLVAPTPPHFHQERARRSYDALLAAGMRLFGATGYDGVGTPDIAAEAGVSVGTLYRYFPDKHSIYLEILRRKMAEAYADTIARLTPERFVGRARHETIAETVAILFEHVLREPQLWASFIEMSFRDPAVRELRQSYDHLSCERLAALISAVVPRDVVPDPEATAFVLYGSAMEAGYGVAGLLGTEVGPERTRAALAALIERTLFP